MIFKRVLCKALSLFMIGASKLLPYRGKVYMFHSVGDDRHKLNISIETFESFLKKLKSKNVIRLEDWESEKNFICLTFDDVADSFYYNAFPLLKKYQLPFTIFVSTTLVGERLFVTEEMLHEIASCNLCTIASHGYSHFYFGSMTKEHALADLDKSQRYLSNINNRNISLYAFPYGSLYACGLKNKHLVARFYKYGFGTIPSVITKPNLFPLYYLPRINVSENILKKYR